MTASKSELFACGHNMQITPLHSHLASYKTDSVKQPLPNVPHTKVPSPSLCDSRVKYLGKSLVFSDDVVSELTPHLISYSKAKEGLRSLFQPCDVGGKTRRKVTSNLVGRHDCRGEPKKHLLCHLKSQTATKPGTLLTSGQSLMPLSLRTEPGLNQRTKGGVDVSKKGQASHLDFNDRGYPKRFDGTYQNSLTRSIPHSGMSSDLFHVGSDLTVCSPPPRDYLSECRDGARPVHQREGNRNRIVLDNGTLFDKVLQETYPLPPSKFCEPESNDVSLKSSRVASIKGYLKWLDLPQATQTVEDLNWKSADVSGLQENVSTTSTPLPSLTTNSSEKFKNQEFFEIFHSWCDKWRIHVQLKDFTGQATLLTDMHNLCVTKRMTAIALVALLAEQDATTSSSCNVASQANSYSFSRNESKVKVLLRHLVSEEMIVGLCHLLNDTSEHIRVPSAIVLYCIDKQNEKAEDVLLTAMIDNSHVEGWASVQCLAHTGVASAHVVKALMLQVHNQSRANKASQLLASLSSKTNLVHSLYSEKLNSSGWLERLAACQIIPILHGDVKKDVRQKLLLLAWDDWNPKVQKAAAQALGRIGHGKMVHDEISRRLADDSQATRLDALKKLHSLNLMTAQLLPIYITCLTDVHISIRIQAIVMAGDLKIVDVRVQNILESLLDDPSWKVKIHVLQSISEIGVCNDSLTKKLLWVIRYENLPVIRAKSCQTIAKLGIKDDAVVQTLQNLLTVEDDPIVLREVTGTLKQLGCSTINEDDMLKTICSEVKRLSMQNIISANVLQTDRFETTRSVMEGAYKLPLSTRDYFNYHPQRRRI